MKNVLLIGKYGEGEYHTLNGVDEAIREALGSGFRLDILTDCTGLTYERLRAYDGVILQGWAGQECTALVAAVITYVVNGGFFFPFHVAGSFMNMKRPKVEKNGAYDNELVMMLGARFSPLHAPYTCFPVTVEKPEHPIARGIGTFTVYDEPYVFEMGCYHNYDVVLSCGFANGKRPAMWAGDYGKGRIAYYAMGHCEEAFRDEMVKKLFYNTLCWGTRACEE